MESKAMEHSEEMGPGGTIDLGADILVEEDDSECAKVFPMEYEEFQKCEKMKEIGSLALCFL
jgi:hypothetical protein